MGETSRIPFAFDFPPIPEGASPEMQAWAADFAVSTQVALSRLAARIEDMLLVGVAADRPAADGSERFFWQTDGTPHLEFDDGTWNTV